MNYNKESIFFIFIAITFVTLIMAISMSFQSSADENDTISKEIIIGLNSSSQDPNNQVISENLIKHSALELIISHWTRKSQPTFPIDITNLISSYYLSFFKLSTTPIACTSMYSAPRNWWRGFWFTLDDQTKLALQIYVWWNWDKTMFAVKFIAPSTKTNQNHVLVPYHFKNQFIRLSYEISIKWDTDIEVFRGIHDINNENDCITFKLFKESPNFDKGIECTIKGSINEIHLK